MQLKGVQLYWSKVNKFGILLEKVLDLNVGKAMDSPRLLTGTCLQNLVPGLRVRLGILSRKAKLIGLCKL